MFQRVFIFIFMFLARSYRKLERDYHHGMVTQVAHGECMDIYREIVKGSKNKGEFDVTGKGL